MSRHVNRFGSLQSVPAVTGVWLLSRIVVAYWSLGVVGDEQLYAGWSVSLQGGSFPEGESNFQYPPGAGLLLWFAGVLSPHFYRNFMVLAIVADALILLILLWRPARRGDSWLGPWTWAVGGVFAAALLYERYDIFPTLFAVAAVVAVGRPATSGIAAGIGAMLKLWPGLALLGLPRRQLPRAALTAAIAALAVWILAALAFDGSANWLSSQGARGLQIEATAAWPYHALAAIGVLDVPTVTRFGSVEIDANFAGLAAWLSTALAVVIIGVIVVYRLLGRLEHVPAGDVVLAAVLAFVVLNRVNSPQFVIWLIGVASAALVDHRSRMQVPAILIVGAAFVTTGVVFPGLYANLGEHELLAVAFQGLRMALLVGALIMSLMYVLRRMPDSAPATG